MKGRGRAPRPGDLGLVGWWGTMPTLGPRQASAWAQGLDGPLLHWAPGRGDPDVSVSLK